MNILRLFPGDAVISRDLCSPLLMVYNQLNIVIHRGGFQDLLMSVASNINYSLFHFKIIRVSRERLYV